jgi:hypothetical protein
MRFRIVDSQTSRDGGFGIVPARIIWQENKRAAQSIEQPPVYVI